MLAKKQDVTNVLHLRAVIVVIICVKNVETTMIFYAAVMVNVILAEQMLIAVNTDGLVVNVKNGIVTIVEILLKIVARNAGQISK
jgi:hypothetical protein